jgi:hypothetical protein
MRSAAWGSWKPGCEGSLRGRGNQAEDRAPAGTAGRGRPAAGVGRMRCDVAPHRIRLSRSRGWRKPSGAVVVSRPTRWGNPFRVGATYLWLAGEQDRTWPVPTPREPGTYDDGVRVVCCPDTATAVAWFRRWAADDYAADRSSAECDEGVRTGPGQAVGPSAPASVAKFPHLREHSARPRSTKVAWCTWPTDR